MTDKRPSRNLAVALVLIATYAIPALFIEPQTMLDIISVPMLVFGGWGLCILFVETWRAFISGEQGRAALGLFGIFLLLVSVVVMRPYGVATRNIAGAKDWLDSTHILPVALYLQALGLMFFTRASAAPYVPSKGRGIGQLIAGVVIGILVASSKALEPVLVWVGKIISRFF